MRRARAALAAILPAAAALSLALSLGPLVQGAGAATTTVRTVATVATVATCPSDHLALTTASDGAAAGTFYWQVDLQNTGKTTCELLGHPGVSERSSTRQLGPPARWIHRHQTGPPVILKPGHFAHATLLVTDTGALPGCHIGKGKILRVYPPNNTAYLDTSRPLTVCTNEVSMRVTHMYPGKGATV